MPRAKMVECKNKDRGCQFWVKQSEVYCDRCVMDYAGLDGVSEVGGGTDHPCDIGGYFRAEDIYKGLRKKMVSGGKK